MLARVLNPDWRDAVQKGWPALASANFRTYFAGLIGLNSSAWALNLAMAWLVLQLGGGPAQLGWVAALTYLPVTFFALFAGVLLDRVDTRRVVIACAASESLVAAALCLLVISGRAQLWHLYVFALVLGSITVFDGPSRGVFLVRLVSPRALPSAIGLNATVQSAARIVGPALAGIIISQWGLAWALAVATLGGLIGMLSAARVQRAQLRPARHAGGAPLIMQLADGLRYVGRTPSLALPLILLAFVGTFGYNWTTNLPLLVRFGFQADSAVLGALNAALGVGSVVGALTVSRLVPGNRLILVAGCAFGLLELATGLAPTVFIAMAVLVLAGLCGTLYSAGTSTILQIGVDDAYRGRIQSAFVFLFAGSTPIGSGVTGWVASVWSIRAAMGVEGIACVIGVAVAVAYARRQPPLMRPAL